MPYGWRDAVAAFFSRGPLIGCGLLIGLLGGSQSFAQTASADSQKVLPWKQTWQVGLVIEAANGPCRGIVAQAPIPTDWPEQQVKINGTDQTPQVGRLSYKDLGEGARLMVVQIPELAAGETAHVLLTLEITKHAIPSPPATSQLSAPARPSAGLRRYLGPSPMIESSHPRIRSAAQQATADAQNDWTKAESIYDWVREKVEYKNGELKGALAALADGDGDCEELTSLFIAMCRAQRIPARTVWVPGHCYPEFYLEDDQGQGRWHPCQAAGSRSFGAMAESKPILQKGDSFRLPGIREPQRYARPVATSLNRPGLASPAIEYVRKQMDEP